MRFDLSYRYTVLALVLKVEVIVFITLVFTCMHAYALHLHIHIDGSFQQDGKIAENLSYLVGMAHQCKQDQTSA